uniref:Uncharacterized protein n=1 Tax=viral metagenome TaxID=1070528 RepID=A0A6H1ZJM6_9ZZZZ
MLTKIFGIGFLVSFLGAGALFGTTCYYKSEAKRFKEALGVQQGQTRAANEQAQKLKDGVKTLIAACRGAVDKPDVFWNSMFKLTKTPAGKVPKGGVPGSVPGTVR